MRSKSPLSLARRHRKSTRHRLTRLKRPKSKRDYDYRTIKFILHAFSSTTPIANYNILFASTNPSLQRESKVENQAGLNNIHVHPRTVLMWSTGLFGSTNLLGFDRTTTNSNQQQPQFQQTSTQQRGLPFQQQFQSPLSSHLSPHLQPLQHQLHQLQQNQRSGGVGGSGATTSYPMAAGAAAATSTPTASSTVFSSSAPTVVAGPPVPTIPSIDTSNDVAADVFGQSDFIESDLSANINIAAAFATMQRELLRIPQNEKPALLMVQRLKPEMLDHEHMLRFLLVDNFNGVVSARRERTVWLDEFFSYRFVPVIHVFFASN